MRAIYLLTFGLFFLQSCSVSKTAGEDNSSKEETADKATEVSTTPSSFIIGEGGGFTGKYVLYRLSSDGKTELYDEKNDTYTEVGNVKKVNEIFEELAELNLLDYEYYKPGNLNYRITISGEGRTNTITWSDNRSPDEKVLFFYKKVMNEIRSLNNY